jgi:hypothetical protein
MGVVVVAVIGKRPNKEIEELLAGYIHVCT